MENKKITLYIFTIIAVILGWTLFKQFDFENLTFENPWLALIYFVTLVFAVFIVAKNAKGQPGK